ncbi:NAD kinase [hydrothermal vent metagenome]|uniref:NAD kinase n=1 Tax=hydrothermal vent metagenome TaxID=652676 RepID=A0A1W1EK95_9ZZZZ
MLEEIKKAGFILKPNSPEIRDTYLGIKKIFNDRGIEVLLDNSSANMIAKSGIKFSKMCRDADFLVSLGGDGTLLSLVRRSYGYNKPVLGINAGNLGFLADVKLDEVDKFLDNLLIGNYRVDDRMMMSAKLHKKSFTEQFYAFNDIVLTRPTISKMVKIDAYIDDENFNTYRGDGLIVATPTGSTAYSLASGGPVMYPLTKAFILSPISPHSLTQRPLVVPTDFTIELISPEDRVIAMVDGQDDYVMEENDRLEITIASIGAKLLHKKERNYFSVLREKLLWGDR